MAQPFMFAAHFFWIYCESGDCESFLCLRGDGKQSAATFVTAASTSSAREGGARGECLCLLQNHVW